MNYKLWQNDAIHLRAPLRICTPELSNSTKTNVLNDILTYVKDPIDSFQPTMKFQNASAGLS